MINQHIIPQNTPRLGQAQSCQLLQIEILNDGGGGRCEARRAEARGPQGRERGWGSWGGGSKPPPQQPGGLGERCELPQQGPGRSPGRQRVLAHFSITRWRLLKLKLQP